MKNKLGVLFIIVSLLFFACEKSDTNIPLPSLNLGDTAETTASLDSTSFGVYKAVLTGNTGRMKIYINNGDTIVKAFLWLDSLADTLTCAQTFTLSQPIISAIFTGRISSFSLSADAAGNNA